MYESFYGLREKPFELHPDPDYLYMSPGHDRVCSHLQYAVEEHKGFVVVTGEIGSGKTTLINYLRRCLPADALVAVVNTPALSPAQFLKMICLELGLSAVGAKKVAALDLLRRHLLDQAGAGRRVILIVDEAQNLSVRTIEEIRMLSNLESDKQGLLQIVLAGQPELREKLRRKELEQLLQRVSVQCHLECLGRQDTGRYIQHRLQVAGREGMPLFTEGAIEIIYRCSEGTPRVVNMLCDTALVYGFAEQLSRVDTELMSHVVACSSVGGLALSDPTGDPDPPSSVQGGTESLADLVESVSSLARRVRELERSSVSMGEELEAVGRDCASVIQLLSSLYRRVPARAREGAAVELPGAPKGTAPESEDRPVLRRIFGGKG